MRKSSKLWTITDIEKAGVFAEHFSNVFQYFLLDVAVNKYEEISK